MLGIGPMELMIVLLIGLLLFGNRLPATMRSLGASVSEFKNGVQDGETIFIRLWQPASRRPFLMAALSRQKPNGQVLAGLRRTDWIRCRLLFGKARWDHQPGT